MHRIVCFCVSQVDELVELGSARSNSWDILSKFWMSGHCLRSEYYFSVFNILSPAEAKRKNKNNNSIWQWPTAMTFCQVYWGCCAFFLLAVTERRVVLICRPHAGALSGRSGFDKPLLSTRVPENDRKQGEALPGISPAGRPQLRLQGLASVCYTQRRRLLYGKGGMREGVVLPIWFIAPD